MTKREKQEELTRRGVKFNVRDTSEELDAKLAGSVVVEVILEPEPEATATEVVLEPEPEAEVAKPTEKIYFITPITHKKGVYLFTTQNYKRKPIATYESKSEAEALVKMRDLLRK